MFNTLNATKKLEDAGVPRQQAEAQVQILAAMVEDDLATKNDLRDLENRLVIKLGTLMATLTTIAIAAAAVIKP